MQPETDDTPPTVSADIIKQRLDAGENLTILDTRDTESYEAWHIQHQNAEVHNIPATAFSEGQLPTEIPDGPLVTCCAKGISSLIVAEQLEKAGYDVESIENGMEGWATLYETYEVPHESATVLQFHRPSSGCLSYMVVSQGEAAVIDPLRFFGDSYLATAEEYGATITAILDTHIHADHVSGGNALARKTGATYHLPAAAKQRGLEYQATLIDPSDSVAVGSVELTSRSLAGHTTEMSGYQLDQLLFSGDTVFENQVARPDLEDTDGAVEAARELYDTITELQSQDVTLAPGHVSRAIVEPHTIASSALVEQIPLLTETKESFAEIVGNTTAPRPESYQQVIAVNLGKQHVDDDKAFSLELGPNNCAA